MPTLNQRGVVHIALILLLLAGLVAGVYLVQQQQIFRPKASGEKVWLIDNSGNNLPQKDGGVYEVPGQEIRIFIHQPTVWSPPGSSSQPQGRLPNLVTAAYAQSSQCNGTVYSCSDIKCPDNSTAPGTGCYEKDALGKLTDPNNRYRTECLRNCPASSTTGGTGSSGTTTNTGTTTDASTPKITGSVTWGAGNIISIPGQDFGSGGTVYYSPGSQQTAFPKDQVSWSSSFIRVNTDLIPECTAAKTVDCLIKGGYVKVCRTDSKCSDFARIPDRTIESGSPGTVSIPTAPKDAPQGQGAPAAPTQQEVTEATQEIRISSVVDYVKKDGVCEGSEDPAKHCMSLTEDNLDQRYTFAALLTKGYVGWWLANTTEVQNVYVGFISNKGQNFVQSIQVRIVRPQPTAQPSARPTPAGGGAPPPAKSTLDTLAGSPDVMCIEGVAYYNDKSATEQVKTGYGCRCDEDEFGRKIIEISDPETGIDLANTTSPCKSPIKPASPTPVGPKQSCREVGVCVKDTDDDRGFYSESGLLCSGTDSTNLYSCPPDHPICLTNQSCKAGCPQSQGGVCVNEERKTIANVTYAGIDESKKYFCSDPNFPICLTSATPSKSASPAPPASNLAPGEQKALRELEKGGIGSQDPGQPVAGKIYVKNSRDQQVTVQKVEQLTSDPVFSFWFIQIGAGYAQLDCKPKPAILSSKQYASCEAIVTACSRSDTENLKEKEVKVEYTGTEAIDPTIGIITREARGKYQCGGSGSVIIP